MKVTEFILDELHPASDQLQTLLNDGYDVVASQFMTPDNSHVYFAAMLVKEEDSR